MKKLCLFDSLKFVRAMFVAVATAFILNVAHADNTWKYTPIPIRYYANDSLVELTESDENFNTYTVKTTTTTANRLLYVQTENSLPANHKYFLNFRFKSNFTHRPYFRCSFDGGTTYESFWYSYTCRSNTWCNLSTIKTPQQDWQFVNVSNGILALENTYTAGETITIDKNGFLTVFDLTEIFGAGNEPATAADAERALSIDTTIKIATTKYSEAQFAPVETRLDAAVAAVNRVVTDTMSQAQAIDQIATNKQTRPDEGCTAKYCLLIEDEDGTPHWYPIAGANGVAHNLPNGYTELQYIESDGASWIDTGIAPTATTLQIDYKMQILQKAYVSLFGAVAGTTPRDGFRIYYQPSDNTNSLTFQAGAAIVNQAFTWNDVLEGSVVVKQGTSIVSTINGNTINRAGGANLTQSATILVGTSYVGSGVSGLTPMKIWSFKITKNGAVVFNGVPAKNANDEIGMYDLVGGQFHANAGTGDFTAGPDM